MKTKIIHIIGAGPAGLIAAINLERAGYHSIVYEQIRMLEAGLMVISRDLKTGRRKKM